MLIRLTHISWLLALCCAYVSAETRSSVTHFLEGKIGSSPIKLRLETGDRGISGEYWYVRYKKPIVFYGIRQSDGKLKLNPKGEMFIGSLQDGSFRGLWSHEKKELPFHLSAVAAEKYWNSLCMKDPREWKKAQCGAIELEGEKVAVSESGDLDGDGKGEMRVACQSLCGATGNCLYDLFVSNRGCFKYVGEAAGTGAQVLESSHHGLKDLGQYWKGGCVGMEGTYSELHFNGTKYEAAKTIKCECRPDPSRPKECPPWRD